MTPPSESERTVEDDRVAIAALQVEVKGMRDDIQNFRNDFASLREEIHRSASNSVTKGEWLQRNAYVDGKFDGHAETMTSIKDNLTREVSTVKADLGREIAEVKQEQASKRLPMTAWAAIIIAGLTFLWTVAGPAITQSDNAGNAPVEQAYYRAM